MGKKYRLSAVKEAPVYHPTEDEFADPLRYIASIRAEAEEFGICRIVPPSSFKVPFNQDAASFSFKTRVQTVNELQLRLKKGKNRSFRTEYADFMQSRGQSVTRWPVFGGKKLDLQALYDNVTQRGGFDAVCRAKGWRDMARVMDTPATVTSAAMALRALYQKWLLDFEQHKARQENLSPAGKAKEAAQTKKEQERLAREEKSKELKDRARRDSIGVEEDLIEALFELGNAAAPPPRPSPPGPLLPGRCWTRHGSRGLVGARGARAFLRRAAQPAGQGVGGYKTRHVEGEVEEARGQRVDDDFLGNASQVPAGQQAAPSIQGAQLAARLSHERRAGG